MSDWYPSNYCSHYGWQWCTAPYDGPPHYPDVPTIRVNDISAQALRFKRRNFWRKARNAALLDWEASGLRLPVFEIQDPHDAYTPGRVTLGLAPIEDTTAGQAAFGLAYGTELPLPGVGWVRINPTEFEKLFKGRALGSLRAIIGHEVGHTFGFAHAPAPACMDIDTFHNTRPTAEEIAALKDYFNV